MNKILESASVLREELQRDERIKEYLNLKKLFEENDELVRIRKQLINLQKDNKIEEYTSLKTKYDSNPLVKNYYSSKEEVNDLIRDIIEVLDI